MSSHGCLDLFIGPMFSGKTTKLIEIYNRCVEENVNVVAINYAADTRYHNTLLSTHDKQMIPCILSTTIEAAVRDHEETIKNAETILINEGQFFPDIEEQVKRLVEGSNKRVYVCGLDGDFERKKFGTILDLIPLCDKVCKLTSLCSMCKDGTPGIFSMRLTNEKQQTVVGSDNYIPVCRKCYEK